MEEEQDARRALVIPGGVGRTHKREGSFVQREALLISQDKEWLSPHCQLRDKRSPLDTPQLQLSPEDACSFEWSRDALCHRCKRLASESFGTRKAERWLLLVFLFFLSLVQNTF